MPSCDAAAEPWLLLEMRAVRDSQRPRVVDSTAVAARAAGDRQTVSGPSRRWRPRTRRRRCRRRSSTLLAPGPSIAIAVVRPSRASGPRLGESVIVWGVAKTSVGIKDDRVGCGIGDVGGIGVDADVRPTDRRSQRAEPDVAVERVGDQE